MSERRRGEQAPQPAAVPPVATGHTAEEEAEVQTRVEDLGYVE